MEYLDFLYSFLIGFLIPTIAPLVIQSSWDPWEKEVTVLVTCLIAGVLQVYIIGETFLPAQIAIIIGITRLTYHKFWKPYGIAPWIETVTNIKALDVSPKE